MRNDEILMGEEIGRLRSENEKLESIIKDQVINIRSLEEEKKDEVTKAKAISWIKNSIILLYILFVLSLIGYPLVMVIFSPDVPSYCTIIKEEKECRVAYIINKDESRNEYTLEKSDTLCKDSYNVVGNVEWGSDIEYGSFKTQEEAFNYAVKNNCKIGNE